MALEALRALLNTQAQNLSWPNSAELQESDRDVLICRDSGAASKLNVSSLKTNLWCLPGEEKSSSLGASHKISLSLSLIHPLPHAVG